MGLELSAQMTQILTCVTPTLIVQLSDRRLTWLSGPDRGTVADDNRNKMTVVCNRLTIAYSGLAEVQTRPTDEWIVDVVSSPDSYSVHRIEKISKIWKTSESLRKGATPKPRE
jgi:hypothetical protein